MPTEVIKYVDPDMGVLADYSSLQAAITAEKAIRSNLVARDEVLKLMCVSSAGSPDTTPVSTSGFATDPARKIHIIADDSYKLLVNASGAGAIYVGCDIILKGVKIEFTGSSNYLWGVLCYTGATGKTCTIFNCQIKNLSTGWSSCVRVETPGGVTCHVINTLMQGQSINFGAASVAAGSLYIYNSIAYNSSKGFVRTGGTILAKNSITQDCADGFSGTFDAASDYNISDLAGDAPGVNSLNSTTVNFADAANGDFRLLAGAGIDQGVDLSSDPNFPFNTDIIGTTRPQGSAWDIGAFELIQQTFNPAWAKHSNQIIRAI